MLVSHTESWKRLQQHVKEIQGTHLRDLLLDDDRNASLCIEYSGIFLDYSHQRVTMKTMDLLFDLAASRDLYGKIRGMFRGDILNTSENRPVLHMALRAPRDYSMGSPDVVPQVHRVLDQILRFSDSVRGDLLVGATGRPLRDIVCIGIGGSYLGAEFVVEALKTDPTARSASSGRRLRFLANVDPVAVERALTGLEPASTLVIVISKTFTTAETMLNAKTVRKWLVDDLGKDAVSRHMCAVSTNLDATTAFGISPDNVFEMWDWVGGRYSVCSAVGMLPLSIFYGFSVMQEFLRGAHDIDMNFLNSNPRDNLPVILGLVGVWNSSFLGYGCRAILPYSEALLRFAAHLQQVDMESNGKRVTAQGDVLDFEAGEINFGEPGTNGQHSFYQLLHQGRTVPAEFIGFINSQTPIILNDAPVSNHDELMSNFFAQPDALAMGKQRSDLLDEKVPEHLVNHKEFTGNRPSCSLLLPVLNAFTTGQLLALYEHRTAVQGFIWGVNSFDQWGVELGKVLGTKVRNQLRASRDNNASVEGFNSATKRLMERYLHQGKL